MLFRTTLFTAEARGPRRKPPYFGCRETTATEMPSPLRGKIEPVLEVGAAFARSVRHPPQSGGLENREPLKAANTRIHHGGTEDTEIVPSLSFAETPRQARGRLWQTIRALPCYSAKWRRYEARAAGQPPHAKQPTTEGGDRFFPGRRLPAREEISHSVHSVPQW